MPSRLTFIFIFNFLFYLIGRKERSNRARDQILSSKCRGCPTLSGEGLKHLYSDIWPHWQAGTRVPSFHWSQEAVSACVFVKGKNELRTTLSLTDKATAAAGWTFRPPPSRGMSPWNSCTLEFSGAHTCFYTFVECIWHNCSRVSFSSHWPYILKSSHV